MFYTSLYQITKKKIFEKTGILINYACWSSNEFEIPHVKQIRRNKCIQSLHFNIAIFDKQYYEDINISCVEMVSTRSGLF